MLYSTPLQVKGKGFHDTKPIKAFSLADDFPPLS
jgi:hypothetical protein